MMTADSPWQDAIPHQLWRAQRITRDGRLALGQVEVDGHFLGECAKNNQAILIDRCDESRAARILCNAAPLLDRGIIWAVAATDSAYAELRTAADRRIYDGRWSYGHQVYDVHALFAVADLWEDCKVRMLLTTPESLRGHGPKNALKRSDVLRCFAPLVALVDPRLSTCGKRGYFDPARSIRDLAGRLRANQGSCVFAIFTECDALTFSPDILKSSLGIEGTLFLEVIEP